MMDDGTYEAFASYASELKRLRQVNAALLEACKAVTKCHGFEPDEPYGRLVLAVINLAEGK